MTTGKPVEVDALGLAWLLGIAGFIFWMTFAASVESCAEASRYEHCVKYHPPKECR